MKLNIIDWIALVLAIIGAINWGLVGSLHLNLVTRLLGTIPLLVTIVYILVGLSGLYLIFTAIKLAK
ncbi:MAG: DUF378 domain-containing protein [Candidatus Saganbacteria bacterium]|nr:DUF378 domain-containing protein [Candidatus Saganbacteria bacterium]